MKGTDRLPDMHLPLGVGAVSGRSPMPVCRLGDAAIRLDLLAEAGLLDGTAIPDSAWRAPSLDAILAAGPDAWRSMRERLIGVVSDHGSSARLEAATVDLRSLRMALPFTVADYVDFYSSLHHATNVGRIFRPNGDPLLPNWRHIPVGYHGRSASISVSGSDVHRPHGIRMVDGAPEFGPCMALDYELEVGFVVGVGNDSVPLSTADLADHVFGVCLVNDWSARDLQAFEYRPLGPFLAKSFHTSISPWITPLAALKPYRLASPTPSVEPVEYLRPVHPWALDLHLEIAIETAAMRKAAIAPLTVSKVSFSDMYWTADQQLAHLTINGATVRTGDLYASGTVSGPDPGAEGSLLERTLGGTVPITLPDGTTRTYLLDGDRVILRGCTPSTGPDSTGLTLGEVSGTIASPRTTHGET